MGTTRKPAQTGSVRKLLQRSGDPVRYDVARGLARHERLVASQSALPEWASELPPSASPRGVSAFAKRAWWLGGTLVVAAALWFGTSPSRPPAPATPHSAARTAAAPSERDREPLLEPLVVTAPPAHVGTAPLPTAVAAAEPQAAVRPAQSALAHDPALPDEQRLGPTLPALLGSTAATRSELAREPASTAARPAASTAPAAGSPAQTGTRQRPSPTRSADGAPRTAQKANARVAAEAPRDAEEIRQLAEAERLLGPEPVRALRLVREGHVAFRSGYFAQERRYIEVLALFALGRHGEAHARAEGFLRDYPSGPYRHRVETEMLRFPVH